LPRPGWATAFSPSFRRCFGFGMAQARGRALQPTRPLVRCHRLPRSPRRIGPGHARAGCSGRSPVPVQALNLLDPVFPSDFRTGKELRPKPRLSGGADMGSRS
jgi:hypothetical protein